jgi:hypothetical protein
MRPKAVARTLLLPPGEPESIRADPNREAFSSGTRIDKDESLNKRESVKMARKKRELLRSYFSQPLEDLRNNHSRYELGMGIFWGVLAAVCGGLAWVLLTILLK